MNISVVGLGKLGACMAAAMADKRENVVGVDVSDAIVTAINAGRAPFYEPHLGEMIARNSPRLRATTDYADAVMHTDVTFLIVPTPSEPDGSFSLRYVRAAAQAIGQVLRQKSDYHLVVLTSTVLPGGTQEGVVGVLEQSSDKQCGADFGVCYSPEFVALGTVIRDFLNPELLLIGEHDARAGDQLEELYRSVTDSDAEVRRMAIANAELTKVALNTYVTTKITFANMLAEMCQSLPGGDVDAVTGALGLDSRIGPRYLSAGLGYGGPCFPRDNRALRRWASDVGAPAQLAESTNQLNYQLGELALQTILSYCSPKASVAILGLTYKPGSVVLDGSVALHLAEALVETGLRVQAYDPLWQMLAGDRIGDRIELSPSLSEAIADANVVVVATPDPAFAQLGISDFGVATVVIDCWRMLRGTLEEADDLCYVGLGLERIEPQPDETGAAASLASSADGYGAP